MNLVRKFKYNDSHKSFINICKVDKKYFIQKCRHLPDFTEIVDFFRNSSFQRKSNRFFYFTTFVAGFP